MKCRRCGNQWYCADKDITLKAATHEKGPDDIELLIITISKCQTCKESGFDRRMILKK